MFTVACLLFGEADGCLEVECMNEYQLPVFHAKVRFFMDVSNLLKQDT